MEELDAFGSILLELKRKIDEQQKIIERINLEKVSLIDRQEFLSKKFDDFVVSQREYEKKFDVLNKSISNLESLISSLNANIDKKLEHQKISQRENIDVLEKKLNVKRLEEITRNIETQIKEYSKMIETLNSKYSDLKNELEPKVEEIIRNSTNKLLNDINSHEMKFKDVERSIKEIKEDKELKEKVSLIAEQLNHLSKQVESLAETDANRANNLKLSLVDQKRRITALDKEWSEFRSSLEESKKYSDRLSKQINELSEKIKELKEETKVFESRVEDNIKKDESFLQAEIDKLSKLFIKISGRVEELSKIEGYLDELKGENKSIHSSIERERERTEKILEENINKIHNRIELESKKTEEKLGLIKEKYSENAKKAARHEVVPIIGQISREQENIRQKLKQMELSFNIQVKNSANFYDILKHEINEIRNQVLGINEGLNQSKDYTFLLKDNLLRLENSLEKAYKSIDLSRQDYLERFKTQKNEIDLVSKDLVFMEKGLKENISFLKKELEKENDKTKSDILKIIDDVKKEKDVKESRRIEKLNEILREFSDRRSQLEERLNVLTEYMNKILETKDRLKREIINEVQRMVRAIESRQRHQEKKILLEDEDIKDIKDELGKLEKSLSEISKEVAVWKEKYKLQLSRLADEVEI